MSTTSLPEVRTATVKRDFSKSREWLKPHRHEYIGQWFVLDCDRNDYLTKLGYHHHLLSQTSIVALCLT